jgi:hypothetical protein
MRTATKLVTLFSGGAAVAAPVITTTSLATATYGQAYSADISVTGTPAPSLSVTSGSLPSGMSLSQVNDTTWRVSGTPTFSGTPGATSETANFTITATNSAGSDPQAYTLTLNHTYSSYSAALVASAGVGWRFRETSGSTAAAYGAWASGLNAALTDVTLAQTGQLGANEAADFNGTTSIAAVTSSANNNQLATASYAFLVNADTTGESAGGRFIDADNIDLILFNSGQPIQARFNYSVTNASAITTTNFPLTAWAWLFVDYTAGSAPQIFIGQAGAVTECSYSGIPVASSGTKTSHTTLRIGNNSAAARTFDGKIDEVLIRSTLLTSQQKLALVTLSGLT